VFVEKQSFVFLVKYAGMLAILV